MARERAAAVCTACENVLAVTVWEDGSVHPIGTGATCSCGNETFDVLDDSELEDVPDVDDRGRPQA
ncbi:hypothetical protein [Halopiger djelfimassiliensis]|uniref:hypothetical protein n=1 Tax=Halopiger djelfimassiliensis TaxID=1293047 RepID=UPI0006777784|nr:hypothetical protein [Halopiger djelfimassiliensis]